MATNLKQNNNIPTGHFQYPNQIPQNESSNPHSKTTTEQNSSPA